MEGQGNGRSSPLYFLETPIVREDGNENVSNVQILARGGTGHARGRGNDHMDIRLYRTRTGRKYDKETCRFLGLSKERIRSREDILSFELEPCKSCKPARL